jgi:tetratricopeptide (TPR) repeat protein
MKSILNPYLTDTQRKLLICLALVIVTTALYWQVEDHDFINFDDNLYVTENPQVQAGLTVRGLKWAFTTSHASNWHPLTWLSHMLDVQLFGMRAGWHHLMNLFFHVANTLLLFLILNRMTKALWQSAFVAALFALHPLHVESVAWVAERKDVLSTFFWILTMGAYVFYVERRGIQRYLPVFLLFALGLMAKPMLVTLPFVLLLLDYWPLGRFYAEKPKLCDVTDGAAPENRKRKKKKTKEAQRKDITGVRIREEEETRWSVLRSLIWEKIPLFALSAVSSAITLVNQQAVGAMSSLKAIPLDTRIANSLFSYVSYIWKMIWPQNLAVIYPHPGMLPPWQVLGAGILLAVITLAVIWKSKSFPYLTVGWLWYLGTLVPVIGLVQVGVQAMADRYTYIPLIGIFIMMAWGVPSIAKRWQYHTIAVGGTAGIILILLSIISWTQVSHWRNSSILFRHSLTVTKGNYIAHNNLGQALQEQGLINEAIEHYVISLQLYPLFDTAHYNLGNAMASLGKLEEAIMHYTKAIRINPNDEKVRNNLGNILLKQGKIEEAAAQYAQVLQIDPEDAKAHLNLGMILASQGKIDEAISHLQQAVQIKPDYTRALVNLGDIYVQQSKLNEAVSCYARAVKSSPDDVEAHYKMGITLVSQGNFDEAIHNFKEVVRIKPGYAKAHNNLGSALLLQKKNDEAIFHFREALRLEPDYRIARDNLRDALTLQHKKR